jgi:hypothetical protein
MFGHVILQMSDAVTREADRKSSRRFSAKGSASVFEGLSHVLLLIPVGDARGA